MASTYVPFKLNNERDADILAAIADAPDKSARLRELIRAGLTVLRNTEGVTRNTPDMQTPPNGFSEKQIAEAAQSLPPQFVPPKNYLMLPKSEQNRIREAWFAEQRGKK